MPAHLHRYHGAGYLHFITTSCYQRRPLLGAPRSRDLFLQVLEQVRQRHRFVVVGYVIMPEHFHLLMGKPEVGDPSTVLQVLKQRVSRRALEIVDPTLSQKQRKDGAPIADAVPAAEGSDREEGSRQFWQRRFYDFNVWSAKETLIKFSLSTVNIGTVTPV